MEFFRQQTPPATVVMEACGSAHHWGRQLQALGHSVRLLPPRYVKPYVRRSKTDRADATALLEAFRNEEIHPVPVKSVSQQAISSLHRLRSAWMATRTSRINAVRGVLRELGVSIPIGARQVASRAAALLEDAESPVPEMLRPALAEALSEINSLEHRVADVERQLRAVARQTPVVERLLTIQGIGLLSATALVCAVGDIQRFRSCRHFASFLGLTPHENSSALKRRLGSISKSGDTYLRTLLVHGGRSVLRAAKIQSEKTRFHLGRWNSNHAAANCRCRGQQARPDRLGRLEGEQPPRAWPEGFLFLED
jgi:transposase